MIDDYTLRKVGIYMWIIKINQNDDKYIKPIETNECGALLWSGLKNGKNQSELYDLLVSNYGVSKDEAKDDVEAFLEQLKINGIL